MAQSFNTILMGGSGVASTAHIGSLVLDASALEPGYTTGSGTKVDVNHFIQLDT